MRRLSESIISETIKELTTSKAREALANFDAGQFYLAANNVFSAASWTYVPDEVFSYWADICRRIREDRELPADARAKLAAMILTGVVV